MTGEFNWTATRKMGPVGLLGLNIPEEYGGSGQGNLGSITAVGGGADLTLPPLATIMLEYEG